MSTSPDKSTTATPLTPDLRDEIRQQVGKTVSLDFPRPAGAARVVTEDVAVGFMKETWRQEDEIARLKAELASTIAQLSAARLLFRKQFSFALKHTNDLKAELAEAKDAIDDLHVELERYEFIKEHLHDLRRTGEGYYELTYHNGAIVGLTFGTDLDQCIDEARSQMDPVEG